ncbi:MAG: HAMP domain-containing histidine kinase [Intrasporangium sp.]|uniref:sensor histidine kinase n=1 Tax=Intrasporangium sp. TaxID=1925024 RepID=UPI0026470C63|nr:HAMP domain-containing sensor histidine kinase [Intrasporangium sp.]MDN5798178.1 HAMP domain-containing histidine kinase [Intrasporangium sp.]
MTRFLTRLDLRLVISHVLVAVVGGAVTFLLVRGLAPNIFDRETHMMDGRHGGMPGGMPGAGPGLGQQVRDQFVSAVDSALVIGVLAGLVAAGLFGAYAAYRLTRPLAALGVATREIAGGHYAVTIPQPGTLELDALADDVRTLAHALQETETRRTRLLSEVAHEMRTPLTVLDGYLEGMIDEVLPATPQTLAQMSGETRRLRRLAEDLSALSRAEEGRLELAPHLTDLRQVVVAAVERLVPQAEDAGVTLTLSRGPGTVPVTVDADRVAQVVTNLVGNALQATPSGGRVTVDVATEASHAVASVTDTGEGLAPADLERIFERFYRVPDRRRSGEPGSGQGGSGIGLTISRRIAEAHGGTLVATSPGRGRGATFTLTLPLS